MAETLILSASLAGNPTNGMSEEHMLALFLLAGIRVDGWTKLPNPYWPDVPEYAHLRKNSPWWGVDTGIGRITLGWRKCVLSIQWDETPIRAIVTGDDVTKSTTGVHAWGYAKAIEYLHGLRRAAALHERPANDR